MSEPAHVSVVAPNPSAVAKWVWAVPFVLFLLTAPLWLHWWEPQMYLYINALCLPVAAWVWTGLSIFGNGWGIFGVTAPLLVLAPRAMWAWMCAAPFAAVLARTGKDLLESPRPAAVVDNTQMRIVGETLHNVSMPSGHTLTAFAVAAGLYFSVPRATRARYAWLWLLAMGAGLSRIAVGAHWPGDVAVGAALGILAGLLGHTVWQRVPATWLVPSHWAARLVGVLLALACYHMVFDELDFPENWVLQNILAVVTAASLLAFVWQNWRLRASAQR
ncbi:phosphatase PAP2 family protein [Rhodoferax aquaticus]|nr:phosphatase PAP2 family protein [Rhodoferax aquaticus]